MKRPFILAGIIGICVIITGMILYLVFPRHADKMSAGFFTPVIAFEFIRTPQEVFDLFGPLDSPKHQEIVKAMDLGNRIDFLYMVLYSAFLFVFCRRVALMRERKVYHLGSMLSLVILMGDFLENVQLLGITSRLGGGDFEHQLRLLRVFTWQKWGGITLIFLILMPYFLQGGILSRIIAACSALTVILAAVAYIHRGIANELFSLSVMVVFLLMISYSFIITREELSGRRSIFS
ncbi:MAG: hypothetical protein ABSA71_07380 [Desulfomonilia bacterium]|jgi:hypothetical protein